MSRPIKYKVYEFMKENNFGVEYIDGYEIYTLSDEQIEECKDKFGSFYRDEEGG